jgi:hypothetical protein
MKGAIAFVLGGVVGALFMAWFYAHGGNLVVGGKTWGPQYDSLATCVNNQRRLTAKVVSDVASTPGKPVPSASSSDNPANVDKPTAQAIEPPSIFNERSANLEPPQIGQSGPPAIRTAGTDSERSRSSDPPVSYTMIGSTTDLSNMVVVMWPSCF